MDYTLLTIAGAVLIILAATGGIFVRHKNNQREDAKPTAQETLIQEQEPKQEQPTRYVTDVKLKRTNKGINIGLLAMLASLAAWGVIYFFTPSTGNDMADAIRYGSIANPVNLAGIAAILSIFGYFGNGSSCMLISAAAFTSILIYDLTAVIVVILPIVLLCITSARFRDNLALTVNDAEISGQAQNTEE